MSDGNYSGLTVELRRREDQGLYLFGVTVNGAFLPFASAKLGGIDDDLAEAAAAAAATPAPSADTPPATPATPPPAAEATPAPSADTPPATPATPPPAA